MKITANNEGLKKRLANLKPFPKGVSGNPKGRPRDPLKEFQRHQFARMSSKEKAKFLNKIDALDRWKMAEGQPHSTQDTKIEGEINITGVNVHVRK